MRGGSARKLLISFYYVAMSPNAFLILSSHSDIGNFYIVLIRWKLLAESIHRRIGIADQDADNIDSSSCNDLRLNADTHNL